MGWRLDKLLHGQENMRLKHFARMVSLEDPEVAFEMVDSVHRALLEGYPGITIGQIDDMRLGDISLRFGAITKRARRNVEDFMGKLKKAKTDAILMDPGWDTAIVNSEWKGNNWGDDP